MKVNNPLITPEIIVRYINTNNMTQLNYYNLRYLFEKYGYEYNGDPLICFVKKLPIYKLPKLYNELKQLK